MKRRLLSVLFIFTVLIYALPNTGCQKSASVSVINTSRFAASCSDAISGTLLGTAEANGLTVLPVPIVIRGSSDVKIAVSMKDGRPTIEKVVKQTEIQDRKITLTIP